MPIDNGNHSRTGKGAETAITPDCTLCYTNADFSRKVRLSLAVQGAQLGHQHLFNEIAAAHITRFRQFIERIDRVGVEF